VRLQSSSRRHVTKDLLHLQIFRISGAAVLHLHPQPGSRVPAMSVLVQGWSSLAMLRRLFPIAAHSSSSPYEGSKAEPYRLL
jgi:hypothetical protein